MVILTSVYNVARPAERVVHSGSKRKDTTNKIEGTSILKLAMHTVSFDRFLSGLQWIINLGLGFKNFWFTKNIMEY